MVMALASISIVIWALLVGIVLWDTVPSVSETLNSDAKSIAAFGLALGWHCKVGRVSSAPVHQMITGDTVNN